jgi:hypothetical protein
VTKINFGYWCIYLVIFKNYMCEILSEISNDKQISTGWNFRLCLTDKFNTYQTISSNKHDSRL